MKKILGLVFGLLFVGTAPAVALDPCRNLFDGQIEQGMLTSGNPHATDSWIRSVNMTPVIPNTKYTVSFDTQGSDSKRIYVFCYNQQGVFTTRTEELNDGASFTTPGDCYNIKLEFQKGNPTLVSQFLWAQLERGETATEYAPYDEIMCYKKIKIATKKYNDTAFSPVLTALNSAIATIKSVVTNTINQAAAVESLQNGKQTMPNASATNGTCPNYKQCLLVETSDGTPQWFVITDPFRDFVTPILATNRGGNSYTSQNGLPFGYTQLEYIESTGTQWINTGIVENTIDFMELDFANKTQGNGFMFVNGTSQVGIMDSRYGTTTKNTRYTITQNFDGHNWQFTNNNGVTFINGTSAPTNLYLFGLNHTSGDAVSYLCHAKIYSFQASQSGVLKINLIPAKSGNTVGMYDTVSGIFFTDSAGGNFVAGPEVPNQQSTWSVTWGNNGDNVAGTVRGEGVCNAVAGTYAVAATSANLSASGWSQSGASCWCKATGATIGQESTPVSSAPWVFRHKFGSVVECADRCALNCAYYLNGDASFRTAIFNTGS